MCGEPIAPLALSEIICVFTFCINKNRVNSWRESMDLGNFHGIILRHLLEYFMGKIRLSVTCYTWYMQFLVFFF